MAKVFIPVDCSQPSSLQAHQEELQRQFHVTVACSDQTARDCRSVRFNLVGKIDDVEAGIVWLQMNSIPIIRGN